MATSRVYSVTQVNHYIKGLFVQDFLLSGLCVRGEVSNLKAHSSGHIYFTLKDEGGALAAVLFAGNRKGLNFAMQDGQKVLVTGQMNVYERDGRYQLYAKEIRLDGVGDLYQRFVLLKQTLEERGMFAPEYKRPIPAFVRTLGVVTAPTGAAIRDIINIARRRNPYVQILLYPALVQGEGAAESVAWGLRVLEERRPDCIIVGRGGGSFEDLWAFNEEVVAQAIFDCETPVISAVGHETDTTIADFVADLRAPTPSAAAELAVFDYYGFMDGLERQRQLLNQRMRERLQREKEKLRRLELSLRLYRPEYRIAGMRQEIGEAEERLETLMRQRLLQERHRLSLAVSRLDGLSPLRRLSGGYAFVSDAAGHGVLSAAAVRPGDELQVTLKDGRLGVRVLETALAGLSGRKDESKDGRDQIGKADGFNAGDYAGGSACAAE